MAVQETVWHRYVEDGTRFPGESFDDIDRLTIATRLVLYDAIRPNAGFDSYLAPISRLRTVRRHFAVCAPPDPLTSTMPRTVPVDILHRLKGKGKPNAYGISVPGEDTLVVWTDRDRTARFYVADFSPLVLSRRAVNDIAGLLLSPMFLNYDPATRALEEVTSSDGSGNNGQYPRGSFDEAAAAYSGVVSFITRSLDLERAAA